MMTPDLYFLLAVTAATIVKLLSPPVETWQEAVATTLSSYIAAYSLTKPLISFSGLEQHSELLTLGVGILMALTGYKLVQAALRLADQSLSNLSPGKMLDLIVMLRTGAAVRPLRRLPPPSESELDAPSEVGKQDDR